MEEKLNRSFFSESLMLCLINWLSGAKVKNNILIYTFIFALFICTKNVD